MLLLFVLFQSLFVPFVFSLTSPSSNCDYNLRLVPSQRTQARRILALSSQQEDTDMGDKVPSMEEECQRLVEKLRPRLTQDDGDDDSKKQYWIGLAGGPGSGKTTVATTIANSLNAIKADSTIVIPMDGWHIPKDDLLAEYGQERGSNRRGAPWTFDVDLMFQQLNQAKQSKRGSLPIYSREISDPIPDGVRLQPSHKIVIVEGIYMLWKDDPKYKQIDHLWDERWFVKCPTRQIQVDRLVNRSIQTWTDAKAKIWGPGEVGARKRAEFNDVQNMDIVLHCEQYADEVIVSH